MPARRRGPEPSTRAPRSSLQAARAVAQGGVPPAAVGVCGRGVLGVLQARRKRFFADVAIAEGAHVVAHCPNTGRLAGLLQPGATVVLQDRAAPRRALRYTWVLVQSRPDPQAEPAWVAIESGIAPTLVEQAIVAGVLPGLAGFAFQHRELAYGPPSWGRDPRASRSRIDLVGSDDDRGCTAGLLHTGGGDARSVWTEVKATTLRVDRAGVRVGAFPDAPTVRGQRQLEDLEGVVDRGQRAAVVFAVMREDVDAFAPADDVDPAYGRALRRAQARGVELHAVAARITTTAERGGLAFAIALTRPLPLWL